jgi:hypothetical protein
MAALKLLANLLELHLLSYGDAQSQRGVCVICNIKVAEGTRVIIELPTAGGARRIDLVSLSSK